MAGRRTSSLTRADLCCPVPHRAHAHTRLHALPPCVHQQLLPRSSVPLPPPPAPRLWPGSRHTVLDAASLSPSSLSVRAGWTTRPLGSSLPHPASWGRAQRRGCRAQGGLPPSPHRPPPGPRAPHRTPLLSFLPGGGRPCKPITSPSSACSVCTGPRGARSEKSGRWREGRKGAGGEEGPFATLLPSLGSIPWYVSSLGK